MKVLFISSGNSTNGIGTIVKNQGESLKNEGIEIDYFLIKGRGIYGYLSNVQSLKKQLKNKYDIIHAHYSLSAYIGSLAFAKPLIVSLMGSDVHMNFFWRCINKIFYYISWKSVIVKSQSMKNTIGWKNAIVLPNGINFNLFKPIDKKTSKYQLDVVEDNYLKKVLFVSNTDRIEKNYTLAKKAIVKIENVELINLYGVKQLQLAYYYNMVDVLLLTSLWEGSPNVIKEAMACNCPIVSTDVGDVREIFGDTKGCYICSYDPEDVAEKLKLAINFGKRTDGRAHIKFLDERIIAKKLVNIYKQVINGIT